ncbi:hypothetical protein [Rhizobium sp. 21-4511-3d]
MFLELVGGLAADAAVNAAYENRSAVLQWGRDFYARCKDGKNLIVMFGCGGTGKSTTGQILSGNSAGNQLNGEYNLSTKMENWGLKGRFFVNVKIPPGQETYRATWSQLVREIIESKRVPIIINVVCWGMHSPAKLELSSIPEFSTGLTSDNINSYRSRRLADEQKALDEIVAHADLFKTKIKFITLVTKQDLWWPDRMAVRQHYQSEALPYQAAISKLRGLLGANNFSHEIWSVSYGHFNHRTIDNHQIFSTAAGYDDNIQNSHLKRFEALIDGMCE